MPLWSLLRCRGAARALQLLPLCRLSLSSYMHPTRDLNSIILTAEEEASAVHIKNSLLEARKGSVQDLVQSLGVDCSGIRLTSNIVDSLLFKFGDDWKSALGLFQWAQLRGNYKHTTYACNRMIDLLGKMRQIDRMWDLLPDMHCRGLVTVETVAKSIRRLAGARRWKDAVMLFDKLEDMGLERNTETMNVLLDALCKEKKVEVAREIFLVLNPHIPPDAYTFNIFVHGWCSVRRIDEAMWTIEEMKAQEFAPSVITYTTVLEAYCKQRNFRRVYEVLDSMGSQGCHPNVITYTMIMTSLAKPTPTSPPSLGKSETTHTAQPDKQKTKSKTNTKDFGRRRRAKRSGGGEPDRAAMSLDELAQKKLPSSEAIQFAQSDSRFRGLSPSPMPIPTAPSFRSLVESVSDERVSLDVVSSHQTENGSISTVSSTVSSVESEKAAYEFLPQTPIKSTDAHLVEFSEAMRTVAIALRRVAEGKAAAQAEAAEWKRKYELERARKQQSKIKGCGSCTGDDFGKLANQLTLETPASDQTGCCGNHGICSHEVLQDEVPGPNPRSSHKMVGRKASFRLSWGCNGDKNGQHKHDFVSFEKGDITTAERSNKQILLKWESPSQTVLFITKPNSNSVRVLCAEMVRWLKEHKNINVFVEPRVSKELLTEDSYYNFIQTWDNDEEIKMLHTKVDLIVTLGGDGTVLWAASLFKGPVPPVVAFSLGSLGFMTPFPSEQYRDCLDNVLNGPFSITLRNRLQCHVIRAAAKDELETEEPILVLNEVTIDRGISSYLTYLECYCDSSFVTCVQGDGLIISTTSGSTAYSLAAGGSMVHPQVPGILFTPICPHSLSFRPLILPEYVTLRVQVPFNSRGQAWASFDGKDRKQLAPGDALICSISPWPVPTACLVDSTTDFLRSINEGLHWNLRKTQSFDGPRD